jgi:hypothetical protein
MQRSPKAIVERARADELDSDFSTAITRLYRRLRAQKADDQIGDSHRTVLAFLV